MNLEDVIELGTSEESALDGVPNFHDQVHVVGVIDGVIVTKISAASVISTPVGRKSTFHPAKLVILSYVHHRVDTVGRCEQSAIICWDIEHLHSSLTEKVTWQILNHYKDLHR